MLTAAASHVGFSDEPPPHQLDLEPQMAIALAKAIALGACIVSALALLVGTRSLF